jgi:hypothetical protein
MPPADAIAPDFFIVGAPKCGTSAMYEFLRQHPALFLPEKKELLVYATDLSYPSRLTTAEFAEHFVAMSPDQLAGTAHTAYLQSTTAAGEIRRDHPDARILIMLRDPAQMLPAWHSELLFETIENIADFGAALAAEPDRRAGRRIPRNATNSYVEALFYSDVARFSPQVRRYLDAFGPERVHVVLHEDFVADASSTYRRTLEFLNVDSGFTPAFESVNANKVARSGVLQRAYFSTQIPGHRLVRALLPSRLRGILLAANRREQPRAALPSAGLQLIRKALADDVRELGELLGRDLSHWLAAPSSPAR